ncbi:unnamed protein product [Brachionus calyciflorus]|uniref:Reverse transcriptase domain-containing protein n=1 Tax=Brachionus calyciflorus TaxID=104777 RepID=A0A813RYW3_9BILA|nr:unnamed protein product [Brachionus calyciflorus]
MLVKNDNEFSNIFPTTLGVKQGGKLSPKLFSIYVNDLIEEIENEEPCLKISDKEKIDGIVYADYIVLISTTKKGLQEQIVITERYGYEKETSYNPSKTTFMVFNGKMSRNAKEQREDLWQEDLVLNGSNITQVQSMKYLGANISDDDKNTVHIARRKKAAYGAFAKVKILGITSETIHPNMKGQLYKIYIRPVLLYGKENFNLNKAEKLAIKRIEGNIVKNMLGLSKKCKSTELFSALNIESSYTKLNVLKCELLTRLKTNYFTNLVLDYLESIQVTDSFVDEIDKISQTEDNVTTFLDRVEFCKLYKYKTKLQTKSGVGDNQKLNQIRDIFNHKNREMIPQLLSPILRYSV